LRWLTLAIFIFALAQPRLSKSTTEVKASGIDIVCALDLSGSMMTPDYIVNGQQVSRIDMAKPVLRNLSKAAQRPHRPRRFRGAGVHRRAVDARPRLLARNR
jgi:hypothetical protein